jgi:dolichol-phosphate mannosyltransferase
VLRDYSCGYRAYSAGFLKDALAVEGEALFANDGFACMVRILLHLAKADAIIGEVPFVLRYDQKLGASKMNVWRTVARTLLVLARERFSGR